MGQARKLATGETISGLPPIAGIRSRKADKVVSANWRKLQDGFEPIGAWRPASPHHRPLAFANVPAFQVDRGAIESADLLHAKQPTTTTPMKAAAELLHG
jgi:hypothetical protein